MQPQNTLQSQYSDLSSHHIRQCSRAGQVSYSIQTNGKVKKVTKYLNQITECSPDNEVDIDETVDENKNFIDGQAPDGSCSIPNMSEHLSTVKCKYQLKQVYKQCHQAIKKSSLIQKKGLPKLVSPTLLTLKDI